MPSEAVHNSWSRFAQVFAAKFVLEVMGGGGASWGFSEVCKFRTPVTQERWRLVARIGGGVFLGRFLLQARDFVKEMRGEPNTMHDETKSWTRLFHVFPPRFLLEVCGGGGAVWGFSQVTTARNSDNESFWRIVALFVASVLFVRFTFQIYVYVSAIKKKYTLLGILYFEYDRRRRFAFVEVFASRLILQVFGAGGAIWGFTQVLTLNRDSNQETFRVFALIVTCLFFVRWGLQMKDFVSKRKYEENLFYLDDELPPQISFGGSPNEEESDLPSDLLLKEDSPRIL